MVLPIVVTPGRYVEVSGTLRVDDLLEVTCSVRATEGTSLVHGDAW